MKDNNHKKAYFCFKSKNNNNYIYDASTNMIYPDVSGFSIILDNFYKSNREQIISDFEDTHGRDNVSRTFDYIAALIKNYNAFYFNSDEFLGNYLIESEEEFQRHISNIRQIVLEVTQSCNFRCSYCIYSGDYTDYRTHGTVHMSEDIAIKSVDRFFDLISSEQRVMKYSRIFINFYGGEPLKNFDLIKKVVFYAKDKISKNKTIKDILHFSVSTNGLLLKDEIVKFFIEHGFLLAISLDGPKEENDKNRLMISGKGSFDKVWNNITSLINLNEEYFKSHVIFLTTLSPSHNAVNIENFFKNPIFAGNGRLKISIQKDGDFGNKTEFLRELKNSYFGDESFASHDNDFSPFIYGLYRPIYAKGYNRKFPGRTDRYTSACKPDEYRFFVSSNGNFHVCERVNTNFSIGDYKSGIQYNKVKKLYENYNEQILRNKCHHCLVKNFCSICFVTAGKGNCLTIDKALCEDQFKITYATLSDLVTFCEKNEKKLVSFLSLNKEKMNESLFNEAFY